MHRLLCTALACALALSTPLTAAAAPSGAAIDAGYFTNLQWRMVGPFRGGRALAVTGVPGQPDHFYFGAVDGGVWESTNAGRTWNPIFDGVQVGSIGAIAVAPSDPRVIYVGTGEADMRSDIAYGNGVYKSVDAGKTWTHIGLEDTRQIGRILVDPHDANVAYVAALGHAYGPNAMRGVFKTTDGGATWNKVLFKDENTGAIDLAFDPADAHTVYASLWQTRRPPWNVYPPSNGPGSGLYKTTDGGATWQQLRSGLPEHVGHIGLATSAANPKRVYALVDSDVKSGGVYRSDDAGATWTHSDGDQRIWQRGWYFGGIAADPKNADVTYVMNTSTYRSSDGGKTYVPILGDPTGDDYHSLWIEPDDSTRMILGSDQGVVVTVDGAKTWSSWYNQPTAQLYHVIADDAFPYSLYGSQQDSGADMQQTSTTQYITISNQDFRPIDVGGESGYLAPDPRHPGLVYGGTVTKEYPATGWEQNIDPTLDHPSTLWRNTWTLPLAFSPADKTSLYFGHQEIFRTRDGGKTWKVISPDLSRANEGRPANLDAPALADDNNVTRHGVVYAIAPSPLRAATVWAGTDDGYVWITTDDGAHWKNVTPPALTSWSKVGIIDASHYDAQSAYLAVDRHRLEDYAPYVYRTHDGGKSWTAIAAGIPNGSFVNVVREDPKMRGLLYAGTEKGVYVSFDDGAHWQSLQLNLPTTSIRDIAFRGDDLAIATHGRSFWVLDDMASLREVAKAAAAGGDYLFAPSPAVRLKSANFNGGGTPLPLDEPQAQNRALGLYVDYYLAQTASSAVTIEAIDGSGTVVRRWSSASPGKPTDPNSVDYTPYWIAKHPVPATGAGAHRFIWDFHRDNPDGPLVPPGTYRIRLTVDGRSYTANATVLRDRRAPATDADLQAQYELAMAVTSLRAKVHEARERGLALLKSGKLPAAQAQTLRSQVVGEPMPENPDASEAAYSHDFTSLLYLENALDYLESAVESADAAPTPTMRDGYAKLEAIARTAMARLDAAK